MVKFKCSVCEKTYSGQHWFCKKCDAVACVACKPKFYKSLALQSIHKNCDGWLGFTTGTTV